MFLFILKAEVGESTTVLSWFLTNWECPLIEGRIQQPLPCGHHMSSEQRET